MDGTPTVLTHGSVWLTGEDGWDPAGGSKSIMAKDPISLLTHVVNESKG